MEQYKLIKEYPGSPVLGEIVSKSNKKHPGFGYISDHCIINFPEFWQKILPKTYEILSVADETFPKNVYNKSDKDFDKYIQFEKTGHGFLSIYSVKRLSDGIIFTINDLVKNYFPTHDHIKSINLIDNEVIIKFEKGSVKLCNAIKIIPKQKLFTTEDGVDVFEGNKYYYIYQNQIFDRIAVDAKYASLKGYYFSAKGVAEEYILLNKQCLSLQELLDRSIETNDPDDSSFELYIDDIKKLVKSKCNI